MEGVQDHNRTTWASEAPSACRSAASAVGLVELARFLWTHNCPKEPRKDEPDDRDFAWIAWCCCWPCGKRGRAQPVHAFPRAIGAGRGSGTGPALERWPQAGGCSASASWRGGGKPVAGTGVPVYRLERWRERALLGIDGALRDREGDAVSEELAAAMRRVGELTMENEVLRARVGHTGPLARRRLR